MRGVREARQATQEKQTKWSSRSLDMLRSLGRRVIALASPAAAVGAVEDLDLHLGSTTLSWVIWVSHVAWSLCFFIYIRG